MIDILPSQCNSKVLFNLNSSWHMAVLSQKDDATVWWREKTWDEIESIHLPARWPQGVGICNSWNVRCKATAASAMTQTLNETFRSSMPQTLNSTLCGLCGWGQHRLQKDLDRIEAGHYFSWRCYLSEASAVLFHTTSSGREENKSFSLRNSFWCCADAFSCQLLVEPSQILSETGICWLRRLLIAPSLNILQNYLGMMW